MPMVGSDFTRSRSRATESSVSRVSLLRSRNHRPRATFIAWLLARAKPTLSGLRMRRTDGKSAATMSALPSADALSTSSVSWATPRRCFWTDARLLRRISRVFQFTMMTDSSGAGPATSLARSAGAAGAASSTRRAHCSNANSIVTGGESRASPSRYRLTRALTAKASKTPRRRTAASLSTSRMVSVRSRRSQASSGIENPRLPRVMVPGRGVGLVEQPAGDPRVGGHGRQRGQAAAASSREPGEGEGGTAQGGGEAVQPRELVDDAVSRIGGEQLVAADAAEGDGDVAPGQPAHEMALDERLAGLVVHREQAGQRGRRLAGRHPLLRVTGAARGRQPARRRALVFIFGGALEAEGEGAEGLARGPRRHRRHHPGVDAARDERAEGNVGDEAAADRVLEQPTHLFAVGGAAGVR